MEDLLKDFEKAYKKTGDKEEMKMDLIENEKTVITAIGDLFYDLRNKRKSEQLSDEDKAMVLRKPIENIIKLSTFVTTLQGKKLIYQQILSNMKGF